MSTNSWGLIKPIQVDPAEDFSRFRLNLYRFFNSLIKLTSSSWSLQIQKKTNPFSEKEKKNLFINLFILVYYVYECHCCIFAVNVTMAKSAGTKIQLINCMLKTCCWGSFMKSKMVNCQILLFYLINSIQLFHEISQFNPNNNQFVSAYSIANYANCGYSLLPSRPCSVSENKHRTHNLNSPPYPCCAVCCTKILRCCTQTMAPNICILYAWQANIA